jgi:hypothetical protein
MTTLLRALWQTVRRAVELLASPAPRRDCPSLPAHLRAEMTRGYDGVCWRWPANRAER